MPSADLQAIDQHIFGSVWTSAHPQQLIKSISYDFGPRRSGSQALRDATEHVATLWRDLGIGNVHTEAVPMTSWQQRHAAARMTSPKKRNYTCFQHNYSSPGNVAEPLVVVDAADEEDLDRLGK